MHAGFAHRMPGGEWVFQNGKMREMLAEFARHLQRETQEQCAQLCHASDDTEEAARRIRNA